MNQQQRTELLNFAIIMSRECPNSTADLLAQLVRAARLHHRLQERACNEQVPEDHDVPCERRITAICQAIGCSPLFSGDPRGATVKLKVPSGRTNDWGNTGICVPTV